MKQRQTTPKRQKKGIIKKKRKLQGFYVRKEDKIMNRNNSFKMRKLFGIERKQQFINSCKTVYIKYLQANENLPKKKKLREFGQKTILQIMENI